MISYSMSRELKTLFLAFFFMGHEDLGVGVRGLQGSYKRGSDQL